MDKSSLASWRASLHRHQSTKHQPTSLLFMFNLSHNVSSIVYHHIVVPQDARIVTSLLQPGENWAQRSRVSSTSGLLAVMQNYQLKMEQAFVNRDWVRYHPFIVAPPMMCDDVTGLITVPSTVASSGRSATAWACITSQHCCSSPTLVLLWNYAHLQWNDLAWMNG